MQTWIKELKKSLLAAFYMCRKYKKISLLLIGSVIIFCVIQSSKLRSLYDLNDLIDSDFNTYPALHLLQNKFSDKNQLQIFFYSQRWTKQSYCELRKLITEFYFSRSDISQLNSTFGLKLFKETPEKIEIKNLIDIDCNSSFDQDVDQEFKKIINTPWNKILNSSATTDLVVNISLIDNDIDGRFGNFDPNLIKEIDDYFHAELKNRKIQVSHLLSGLSTYKLYLKDGYQIVQALNGLILILSIFFFWIFYRSIKASFIFIGSMTITLIILYGLMASFNHPIDMLTNALPLMLTMSCLEDFVFICHSFAQGKTLKKTWHRIILPTFLTSVTTAIGFGSLAFSDLSIIRRFGLWAAAGAMIEWFILFITLPILIEIFPKLIFKPQNISLPHFTNKPKKWFKWSAIALIPLALISSFYIEVNDSPEKLFKSEHVAQKTFYWLKENKGWTSDFSILFRHDNIDIKTKIESFLQTESQVVSFESPLKIEKFLTHNISPQFQVTVKHLWEESAYSKRLIADGNLSRFIVYLENSEMKNISLLQNKIETTVCTTMNLDTCLVTGTTIAYAEFGGRILTTLLESLALSLILVSLVIFIFRTTDTKTTLYLIISSMWGPLVLLLIMSLFNISIFYVTSICASLLVGLAGDNAIQFMYHSKYIKKSVLSLQEASLKIIIGMILICLVLFLTPFVPLIQLGGLFVISFVLLYIGDVIVLKALLNDK